MFADFSPTWQMAEPCKAGISFSVLAAAVAHLASLPSREKCDTGASTAMASRTARVLVRKDSHHRLVLFTSPIERRRGPFSPFPVIPIPMRRSSVSVSSNIAEGSSRSSRIDFNRFIEIAYGSLLESVSELRSLKDRFRKDLQASRRMSQNVKWISCTIKPSVKS